MSSQTTPSPATLSVGKTTSADPRPYTTPGKRAYVKPELIILDGDRSEGVAGAIATRNNKLPGGSETTNSSASVFGPS